MFFTDIIMTSSFNLGYFQHDVLTSLLRYKYFGPPKSTQSLGLFLVFVTSKAGTFHLVFRRSFAFIAMQVSIICIPHVRVHLRVYIDLTQLFLTFLGLAPSFMLIFKSELLLAVFGRLSDRLYGY